MKKIYTIEIIREDTDMKIKRRYELSDDDTEKFKNATIDMFKTLNELEEIPF